MNLPSSGKTLPFLAVLLIALVLVLLPLGDSDLFATLRYARCTHLAATRPVEALAMARGWRAMKPLSPLARHCEAVALFATRDYAHAADAFLSLARDAGAHKPSLSSELALQAARSYLAAGKYDEADRTAGSVLALSPDNREANDLLAEIAKEKPPIMPAAPPGSAKPIPPPP